MNILFFLLTLFCISGCASNGYDRHYIVSDAIEETFSSPEND